MFDELNNEEVLIKTIEAYKNYIDCKDGLDEHNRSDLLMVARELDGVAIFRGIYGS